MGAQQLRIPPACNKALVIEDLKAYLPAYLAKPNVDSTLKTLARSLAYDSNYNRDKLPGFMLKQVIDEVDLQKLKQDRRVSRQYPNLERDFRLLAYDFYRDHMSQFIACRREAAYQQQQAQAEMVLIQTLRTNPFFQNLPNLKWIALGAIAITAWQQRDVSRKPSHQVVTFGQLRAGFRELSAQAVKHWTKMLSLITGLQQAQIGPNTLLSDDIADLAFALGYGLAAASASEVDWFGEDPVELARTDRAAFCELLESIIRETGLAHARCQAKYSAEGYKLWRILGLKLSILREIQQTFNIVCHGEADWWVDAFPTGAPKEFGR